MKVTIIGAGNVATHLVKRLYEKECVILQVFNRTLENAQILANQVGAEAINAPQKINDNADIYIVAISDDAIKNTVQELSPILPKNKIIVHTSGATTSKVFESYFDNYGVFYPLQTFSKKRKVDFEQLPMCIDGSNDFTRNQLLMLAQAICPNIYHIDDKQRATLHIAAVFANNFANYLFTISEQIVTDENIPFSILRPLINETVAKISETSPVLMQTGPARRGDKETVEKHQQYLRKYPNYYKIYEILSQNIQELYSSKKDSSQ